MLVGEIAAASGGAAPVSFLIAALVAGFTGFSYAELSSRIPKSAGEAAFLGEAFTWRGPAAVAGYGVVFTGIVSAATISNGFYGYLREFVDIERAPAVTVTVVPSAASAIASVILPSALLVA